MDAQANTPQSTVIIRVAKKCQSVAELQIDTYSQFSFLRVIFGMSGVGCNFLESSKKSPLKKMLASSGKYYLTALNKIDFMLGSEY
jgi:hypothetical protein